MPIILGQLVLAAIIGYLWGSIPAGYWMGKLLRGKDFDIRDYGSRKIGATNVLRTLGKGPAAIVFVFDLSKGVGPTLVALLVPFLHVFGWGPAIAGVMALLGHCYPVFIGFKGGRGVLTGGGALLVISPVIFLISHYHDRPHHSHYALRLAWLNCRCALLDYLRPHIFLRRTRESGLFCACDPGRFVLFNSSPCYRHHLTL